MKDQFTETLPFQHGSQTSEAAAEEFSTKAPSIRQVIHAFLKSRGRQGATADEIEEVLGISGNTVRPRLVELHRGIRIYKSSTTRATRAGRQAAVWIYVR